MSEEKETCPKWVCSDAWSRGHQCTKPVWKDGFCKVHHPDSVAERSKKREERYEENKKTLPWYQLIQANKRIAELEAEILRLTVDNTRLNAENEGRKNEEAVQAF